MIDISELLKERKAETDKEALGEYSCTMTKGKGSVVFEMCKWIVTSYVKTDLLNTYLHNDQASGPLQNIFPANGEPQQPN